MENPNKVGLPITIEKALIDFGEICRLCLCQTKSNISINDKCLSENSAELEDDSIFNFMTKLKFIKKENSNLFPTRICENCFDLIKLCYNFSQICQKSDSLLRDCYDNILKARKGKITHEINKSEFNIIMEEPNTQEIYLLDCSTRLLLLKKLNAVDETSKFMQTKITESGEILETYRQKLKLLSGRIKQVQSVLAKINLSSTAPARDEQCPHACSQCSLKFNNIRALDLHFVTTHGQKIFRFQCKNCSKSFTNQIKLNRHSKLIHEDCESEFPVDYLSNKVMQSIQTEGKNLICFHCIPNKKFQSQDQLAEHFQELHDEKISTVFSKSYSCTYCNDSTFATKFSLSEHLLVSHNLKMDEIPPNDVKCPVEDLKPPKVFVGNSPPLKSKQFQNVTDFLEFLDVLYSVIDSLIIVQQEQGSGFKVLCKNCNPPSEFTSAQDFINHMHTHQDGPKRLENCAIESETKKSGVWNCSECSASYGRKQSLYYHLREKHKQTNLGRIKCPEFNCVESFATNRQLIRHGISVHQKYFACFHEIFKKVLLTTGEEEEAKKIKNFECDICQRRYIYKTSLRKHILTAHLGKLAKNSVVCSYCGKTLSSKLNLKSHIEFVHEALFVSCPICKKKINFKTIGKHYKTHKGNSEEVYSKNSFLCNLCGKILKSKRSFEDHQKLHKNVRDELCDICGSGFTTKKFLRLHKKIHEGVQRKIFNCDQCDKVFSGRHTLNRHLLTHSGEKNFICEICSKCFYTLQELNRHVRYHKKEYRFNCQLCEMRFLDKSRFRHHMMKHRNVRPHKCQFCEKMFIVRGKMHLHMASKHNVEVQNTKGIWKDPKTYIPLDDLL